MANGLARLAEFYRRVFGWWVEQMEAVDYWRIDTGSHKTNALNCGLTYRALSDLSGWIVYIRVPALDETVEVIKRLGGSVVRPKTAANDGSLGMPPWVIFLTETEKVT